MPGGRPELKPYRRGLRNDGTPAEAMLWNCLKNKQLGGRKFRRQHSIGPYILDFYCPSEALAVELDGAGHCTAPGQERDAARTAFLRAAGIRVVRFENRLVFECPELVLDRIAACFRERDPATSAPPPRPSGTPPQRGGESRLPGFGG